MGTSNVVVLDICGDSWDILRGRWGTCFEFSLIVHLLFDLVKAKYSNQEDRIL